MADIGYEAPAKVNLSLVVGRPDAAGYHPLRSLVQALEWCDLLELDEGDDDTLVVEGADLPEGDDNLVWKAVTALGVEGRPPLRFVLTKSVPVAAGLGGGSSDGAAALRAVADLLGLAEDRVVAAAPAVGADVAFFLTGGTALMEGRGEAITPLDPLGGFAIAVAVPPFELSTPEVYRTWDRMDGPMGEECPTRFLPPGLRREGSFRNDLAPAALELSPELGDWIDHLAARWERPVMVSGSGPSLFAYFTDDEEAADAIRVVPGDARAAVAAPLRRDGVRRRKE